jgi:hypothetical protein
MEWVHMIKMMTLKGIGAAVLAAAFTGGCTAE